MTPLYSSVQYSTVHTHKRTRIKCILRKCGRSKPVDEDVGIVFENHVHFVLHFFLQERQQKAHQVPQTIKYMYTRLGLLHFAITGMHGAILISESDCVGRPSHQRKKRYKDVACLPLALTFSASSNSAIFAVESTLTFEPNTCKKKNNRTVVIYMYPSLPPFCFLSLSLFPLPSLSFLLKLITHFLNIST